MHRTITTSPLPLRYLVDNMDSGDIDPAVPPHRRNNTLEAGHATLVMTGMSPEQCCAWWRGGTSRSR